MTSANVWVPHQHPTAACMHAHAYWRAGSPLLLRRLPGLVVARPLWPAAPAMAAAAAIVQELIKPAEQRRGQQRAHKGVPGGFVYQHLYIVRRQAQAGSRQAQVC